MNVQKQNSYMPDIRTNLYNGEIEGVSEEDKLRNTFKNVVALILKGVLNTKGVKSIEEVKGIEGIEEAKGIGGIEVVKTSLVSFVLHTTKVTKVTKDIEGIKGIEETKGIEICKVIRALPECVHRYVIGKIGDKKMKGNEGIEAFAREYKGSPRYFDIRGNSFPPVSNIVDGKNTEVW